MPRAERTPRDRIYRDLLVKYGPLSNVQLCEHAMKITGFSQMTDYALEKDVDRFVRYQLEMGTIARQDGKLSWLPSQERLPRAGQLVLNNEGILTSRAGVKCEHCGQTIDLTTVEMKWRPKSHTWARVLHVHHFFRVTCKNCGFEGKYDTGRDVKPILG